MLRCEAGIEARDRRTRIDAELVVQPLSECGERGRRLGTVATEGQGLSAYGPETLAEWMVLQQPACVGDHLAVAAQRDQALESQLPGLDLQLPDPTGGRGRER
jgi:hypothetical protein